MLKDHWQHGGAQPIAEDKGKKGKSETCSEREEPLGKKWDHC